MSAIHSQLTRHLFGALSLVPRLKREITDSGADATWLDNLEHIVESAWVMSSVHDNGTTDSRFLPGQRELFEVGQ